MATYRYTNTSTDGLSLKLNERLPAGRQGPIYGSSRLGSFRKQEELLALPTFSPQAANPMQQVDLNYELTDHLGRARPERSRRVCAVVTGRLLDGNGGGTPKQPELLSAQGYEAGGSLLPGRNYSSDSYRFGFNGMEKDDEMHGATGTSYDFGARLYDTRVGRWLSIDPLAGQFPTVSPYLFAFNSPIYMIDEHGKSGRAYKTDLINQATGRPILRVVSNWYIYGEALDSQVATVIQSDLHVQYNNGGNYFTHTDVEGVKYDVVFEFTTNIIESHSVNAGILSLNVENNYYEVDWEDRGDSYTLSGGVGGNTGIFSIYDINKHQSTPAHEANHGFGGLGHPVDPTDYEPDDCIDIRVPQDAGYRDGSPINARDRRVTQGTIDAILREVNFNENGVGDVGMARRVKATRDIPGYKTVTE